MQVTGAGQETPDSAAPCVFVCGTGVAWRAHLVPFQYSANPVWKNAAFAAFAPTAVHDWTDVHDTPYSSVPAGAASF